MKKIKYFLPVVMVLGLASCSIPLTRAVSKGVSVDLKKGESSLSLAVKAAADAMDEISSEVPSEEVPVEEEPVTEEEIKDEKLEKIESYLSVYDSLTSDGVYSIKDCESDREEYAYKLEVSFAQGEEASVMSLYFNEKVLSEEEVVEEEEEIPEYEDIDEVVEDEDDDFEEEYIESEEDEGEPGEEPLEPLPEGRGHHHASDDEDSVKYEGILVKGEEELPVHGKRIVKDEYTFTKFRGKLGEHSRFKFESYASDLKQVFSYQVTSGWDVESAFYYSNEVEDGASIINFVTYDEENFAFYTFKSMRVGDAIYMCVQYVDNDGWGEYELLKDGDEAVYHIIDEGEFHFRDDEEDEYYDDWGDQDEWYNQDEFDNEYDDWGHNHYGDEGHGHHGQGWEDGEDSEGEPGHHGPGHNGGEDEGEGSGDGEDDDWYDDWFGWGDGEGDGWGEGPGWGGGW